MITCDYFTSAFRALTGHDPFPWQRRAFYELARGTFPTYCSLPTGTGKTSLITIWLIALSWQAAEGRVKLPRRLVWVVNRRVVVDQATDEAERLVKRLAHPGDADSAELASLLAAMARDLQTLSLLGSMGHPPVAISTLRGQLADNGDWKIDPSRPSIVIGTVDMIGSRLLFSGYGDGKYKRASHAGLLGQDAWVVLDEAHLTPAFAALLQAIHTEQGRVAGISPWRFALLTATQRTIDGEPFALSAADKKDPVIGCRLTARKSLTIHDRSEKDDELDHIAQLALHHRNERKRVIVFVKSPESANKVAAQIGKGHRPEAVRLLTGTQRGFERDALALDPTFVGFRSNAERGPPDQTHYLVATAAGEVGADLDADHMVCDFAPLDSLIQRFGRVNRLGLGEAQVDLVVSSKRDNDQDKARYAATLDYLRGLPKYPDGGYSLSPADLTAPPQAAFSATPPVIPLAHHWLDMWSLTSIGQAAWPDRPEVAPWLHGVVDDLPETWVVWRDDVHWLGNPSLVSEGECAKALDAFPILPQERLREPTGKVWRAKQGAPQACKLVSLAQHRHNSSEFTLVLSGDGAIAWRGRLGELISDALQGKVRLAFATLLLPTSVGGLSRDGTFDPHSSTATDPAEANQRRRRFLLQADGAQWHAVAGTQTGREPVYTASSRPELVAAVAKAEGLKPVATVALASIADDAIGEERWGRCLLYLAEAGSLADSSAKSFIAAHPQPLEDHLRAVGWTARRLIERMAEAESRLMALRDVLGQAGEGHDTGKDRSCWQRAIGNPDLCHPLAKSGHDRFNSRLNGGYRHEFGAVIDAAKALPPNEAHRDLILHLIAAHHGSARPHFKEAGYDRESPLNVCREAAAQTLPRFGHLQARFGWWGLAYLEAILKAADALVSAGLVAPSTGESAHESD